MGMGIGSRFRKFITPTLTVCRVTQNLLSTPVEGTVELPRASRLRVAVSDCFLECLMSTQVTYEAEAKPVVSRDELIPQNQKL